ncbi:hypothetical protein MOE19_16865 [Bacillus atrophaeus]|uniref:hypothetical protein n=1 Tax=Bacillus atrophaeus TaxID=1452 RepID=UPI002281AD78|nr:hypothetical protein [Bacillus atrophaeus]MCY8818391.1 hypothetical protein [Bacillus atrophaeus]
MWVEILRSVIAPVIGLIGVLIGSKLKENSDIKIRKEFLVREMRIQKYQELSIEISDFLREIGKLKILVINLEKKEITHEVFCEENDNIQDRALKLRRIINVKKPFLLDKHAKLFENIYDEYLIICNLVYEGYHNPGDKKKFFKPEEVTYQQIIHRITKVLDLGYELAEEMNSELVKEMKNLI